MSDDPKPEEAETGGGVPALFIRRPVATLMLMAGFLMIGFAAYVALPIAPLPMVDVATFLVTAELSGADPRTNADAVTGPLENQFGQIPGLVTMTSQSANSYAEITLQFGFHRTVTAAAGGVQAAINAAASFLPSNLAQPPIYRATNPADPPELILALTSRTLPLTTVDDYAEGIMVQRLSQVDGVGVITIGGQHQPAMRLEMDPVRLAALNLTIGDVRKAVIDATTITSKGVLEGPGKAMALQANDQLVETRDYDGLVIAWRDRAPVTLRDMGHAEIGPANRLLDAWYDGRRAIILNILLQPGANAIKTVDLLKKQLPALHAALPPAIELSVVSDRTTTIRASVSDVEKTLLLTIFLVVLTIFVFLRSLWATVIPGVAMVVSLLGTAAVMYALGFSLDNLSLMALSISIGFLVDDAVVMIENIARTVEQGLSPFRAALRGAGEIGFTIMSITVSLVAVFIPLFLMAGVVGKMLQEFAITVAAAIVVSAFVSLTLTPTLCALLLKPERKDGHGRLYRITERGFERVAHRYDRMLTVVLRHERLTLLVMAATVALTAVLFVTIPKGFFPQQDTGLITGITEAAQDVSTDAMGRLQQAVAARILREPGVASVASYIGPGPSNAAPNQGRMFVTLKPLGERPGASAQQIIARLAAPLRQIEGVHTFLQAAQDVTIGARTSKSEYQYTMVGSDPAELSLTAARMVRLLRDEHDIADVTTDQAADGPQTTLAIDRVSAARYGLTTQAIDTALDDAFASRVATRVYGARGQYFVIAEAAAPFRQGADALDHVYLRTSAGSMIRLSQVARFRTGTAPIVINRQNQSPSVTISFNVVRGASIGAAVASIERAQGKLHLPLTVSASFEGSAKAYTAALAGQGGLIGGALVVIYLILGMLYESWSHPITIISTLPSAGLGALLALMLAGMPLDVIGIIGIILLIGIVKKNGIMMVDFARNAEAEGATPREAIHQACVLRFRPILMTTICAMLGGVPLMFPTGIGSQIRQPLGFAIVGGLAVSQVLTLFTTPVIYIAIDRLAHWRRRRPAIA